MTISFYLTSDQRQHFIELYKEMLKLRLEKGEYAFSQSNFFMEILNYYIMNKDKKESI